MVFVSLATNHSGFGIHRNDVKNILFGVKRDSGSTMGERGGGGKEIPTSLKMFNPYLQ